jgi:GTP-binding protein
MREPADPCAHGNLRGRWKPLIEGYLGNPDVRGVIQLIDSRQGATPDDVQMLHYLSERGLPTMIVLTKVDKLKGNARRTELAARVAEIGFPEDQMLPVSSTTGEGCDTLLESMAELLHTEAGTP